MNMDILKKMKIFPTFFGNVIFYYCYYLKGELDKRINQ